jgi:BirA family biotin operon repressor/biotin-[acetyl-CoA-carboxylase] ligase
VVVERALAGDDEGLVLVAEHQTAGRGRLDRTWETPARAALTFSVLLRPRIDDARWTWLPLLAGLAVTEGIEAAGGPRCELKWPNDVLCRGGKVGGLLVERVETTRGPAAVLGVGLNVSTTRHELPVETATSLLLESQLQDRPSPDRTVLLRELLVALGDRYREWADAEGDARQGLAAAYLRASATVGRDVRIQLPSGAVLEARAVDVDPSGSLVVEGPSGRRSVSAGDVVHVRAG